MSVRCSKRAPRRRRPLPGGVDGRSGSSITRGFEQLTELVGADAQGLGEHRGRVGARAAVRPPVAGGVELAQRGAGEADPVELVDELERRHLRVLDRGRGVADRGHQHAGTIELAR